MKRVQIDMEPEAYNRLLQILEATDPRRHSRKELAKIIENVETYEVEEEDFAWKEIATTGVKAGLFIGITLMTLAGVWKLLEFIYQLINS